MSMVPDLELATLQPYREEWGDSLRLHDFVGAPATSVIDSNGIVRATEVGEIKEEELDAYLRNLSPGQAP